MARPPKQRQWHYMTDNKSTTTPTSLVFLDTETTPLDDSIRTDGTPHKLRLWCATRVRLENGKVHSRTEAAGTTADEWWQWLRLCLDPRRPTWVWGHNLSFDLLALDIGKQLVNGPLKVRIKPGTKDANGEVHTVSEWSGIVAIDGQASIIETRHENTGSKCVFIDSCNWWRCSLAELGESVGIPKLAMPDFGDSDDKWLQYCRQDVDILERAVLGLVGTIRNNDLGHMRYTAPGQGLQAYRHRFMDHRILVHNHGPSLNLERQAYFGGVCEVRKIGHVVGPIHVLDVQSYYPSIGANCTLPYRWVCGKRNVDPAELLECCKSMWVIARVKVKNCTVPLPVKIGPRLILAVGNFTTALHWPDLCQLSLWCDEWKCEYASFYYADRLFTRYVHELWTMRRTAELAGNHVEADCIKLILNGLQGKLGQRQPGWIDRPDLVNQDDFGTWKSADARTGEKIEYRCIAGMVQERKMRGRSVVRAWTKPGDDATKDPAVNDEAADSCPSIAGAMTAWGRNLLRQYIVVAGPENVFYTDTDCIHVNDNGLRALHGLGEIKDGHLGYLKLVRTVTEAEYLGPKAYRLDGKWTVAGMKKNAIQTGRGQWRQQQFTGWPALLSAGIDGELVETWIDCKLEPGITPAQVDADGRVHPIRL